MKDFHFLNIADIIKQGIQNVQNCTNSTVPKNYERMIEMGSIRICVAEREEDQRLALVEKLSAHEGFMVVGSTGNGMEAVRMIVELMPDVFICNIILPMCDAFSILDQIQSMKHKPKTIITTSLATENTIQKAFAKGVDEYMIKPVDMTQLVKKIYELSGREEPAMHNSTATEHFYSEETVVVPFDQERTRQAISTLFLRIGLPAHLLGYRFAQEAVLKLVEDPMLMKNRTKVLYPAIADMHHTSAFCVERAIRHVITLTWERGIAERYEKEYGQNSRLHLPVDKPTSGEFIALLAEYVRPKRRNAGTHQGS